MSLLAFPAWTLGCAVGLLIGWLRWRAPWGRWFPEYTF